MKFTRETLEELHDALTSAVLEVEGLLEVVPDGCQVLANIDYFTPEVACLSYSGDGRFPVVPIQAGVIALDLALSELNDAADEIVRDRGGRA